MSLCLCVCICLCVCARAGEERQASIIKSSEYSECHMANIGTDLSESWRQIDEDLAPWEETGGVISAEVSNGSRK